MATVLDRAVMALPANVVEEIQFRGAKSPLFAPVMALNEQLKYRDDRLLQYERQNLSLILDRKTWNDPDTHAWWAV